ncbi:hypothetical protein [Spiribacter onubensis]|uniref:Uncharacterized protein n=1 Tax=Spiribacter onubensis TaxID=3122420 RepID=A0ABV3S6Y0_9GAMM
MSIGGILAGAMAGAGSAVQYNAQNQLKQQREEALAKLERDFKRDNLDYEYGLKKEVAAQEAFAEEAGAIRDAEIEIAVDAAKAATEERLNSDTEGPSLEDVSKARDRAIRETVRAERDRQTNFGFSEEPIDFKAIAQAVSKQYANLYPQYGRDLMRGFPSIPSQDENGGDGSGDPLGIK